MPQSFSFSKVDTFHSCPYKFKLRYIDKLDTKPDMSPSNPLFVGTAAHEGIEHRSVDSAIESYKSHYTEFNNLHELEILKLKTILPKAFEQIPEGEYEHKLSDPDGFIGYIDCLVPIEEGVYDLLDFKCSNNVEHYKTSPQVHVYKYYYERITGNKIRDLYYVFIPKSTLTLNESMSDDDIRSKVVEELSNKDIHFEKIEYDRQKVNYFFARKTLMSKAMSFEKRKTKLCNWCDYCKYCSTNGEDTSELTEESIAKLSKPTEPKIEAVSLF